MSVSELRDSVFSSWIRSICGPEQEDTRTLLERFRAELVGAAVRDLGIVELAPNDSPEIRRWLADVGINYPAAYCAAWTSAKVVEASIACGLVRQLEATNDVIGPLPLEPSAGALKLAFFAEQTGGFVRHRRGIWPELEPGDLLFWKRPGTGQSWTGHVGMFETWEPAIAGTRKPRTIEANVPDQRGREGVVNRTRLDLNFDPLFLGHLSWGRVRMLTGGNVA